MPSRCVFPPRLLLFQGTVLRTNSACVVIWRLTVGLLTVVLLCPVGRAADTRQPVRPPDRLIGTASPAAPDTADAPPARPPPRFYQTRLSVWGAGSAHPGGVLGTLQDGWVGLLGLRYHRLLIPRSPDQFAHHDGATLTYTADLIPLARVTVPKGTPPAARSLAIRSVTAEGFQTYGVGVYPLGLRVGFRPASTLRPFIDGHTGLFHLFDAMPDERGQRLNFAAGVGVGLEVRLPRRTVLTLGYRYHHLSNGFRGRINPGLDANLLYIGVGMAP